MQSGAVPEVISRWLEAAPGAPGGSWFPCSFLHLLRRPSQGGWRQFLGPLGGPGFSARSFTCFGGILKVVGSSSKGPRKFLVSLLVPSPVSEVISRWLAAVPRAPDFLLSALLPGSGMRFSVLAGSLVKPLLLLHLHLFSPFRLAPDRLLLAFSTRRDIWCLLPQSRRSFVASLSSPPLLISPFPFCSFSCSFPAFVVFSWPGHLNPCRSSKLYPSFLRRYCADGGS